MCDFPLAAELAVANGRAHPHIGSLPTGSHSRDAVEAMGKGDVVANSDAQIANFIANGTSERLEPSSRFC